MMYLCLINTMKITLNRSFTLFLLITFLYVQVPFAIFHHHDHKPVCELNDHSNTGKPFDATKKHFHENTHAACFLCSAQLVKEYAVKGQTLSFAVSYVSTPYAHSQLQLSTSFHCSYPARAPPVLS